MPTLISIILQFITTASDPSWSCELTHRDPDVAGTFYFYCAQISPDGVELIQVGRFISDERAVKEGLKLQALAPSGTDVELLAPARQAPSRDNR